MFWNKNYFSYSTFIRKIVFKSWHNIEAVRSFIFEYVWMIEVFRG